MGQKEALVVTNGTSPRVRTVGGNVSIHETKDSLSLSRLRFPR